MSLAAFPLLAALASPSSPSSLAPPTPATVTPGGGWHEDTRFGFKLKPPSKFEEIPTKIDEQWIAARFLSEKFDIWVNPDTGYDYEFKPTLTVIGFFERADEDEGLFGDDDGFDVDPDGEAKKKGEGGDSGDGDSDGDDDDDDDDDDDKGVIKVGTKSFENYEDYLDRTYSGGGFFIDSKESSKHSGLPVTQYEIKVEKLSYDGPKRITTWVYHCEGVDIAVQFEVLEERRKDYDRDIKRTFKSFKPIPRDEDAGVDQSTGGYITLSDMRSGTPEENERKRKASEESMRARAAEAVADGWTAKAIESCFVINHTDDRYAKKVVAQVEGVMGWLDETFPFVGPEEYVRGPIIRICDSYEEEQAYREGSNGFWMTGSEIVTHRDRDGWTDFENDWTNQRVLDHWFQERDIDLYFAMPAWLSTGLREYVGQLRPKGRGVELDEDGWDRDWLREDLREGRASKPRDIMRRARADFSNWGVQSREAAALVRFLMSREAQKNKQTRDVLPQYMRNLKAAIEEVEAREEKSGKRTSPKTEEEEERQFRERRKQYEAREKELVEDVWFRTFKSWSDRDWDRFEKAYFEAID